jgi:signal peptidase I
MTTDQGQSGVATLTPFWPEAKRKLLAPARRFVSLSFAILMTVVAAVAVLVIFFTNHVYITTPSMYPTLPPGSIAIVEKMPSYHVGDVIEFRGNGLVFLHRIIKIGTTGDITTKGDNPENAPDVFFPPTTKADVIGKEVLGLHWLGFPELFVHHPEYAMTWLRAELGWRGKLELVAIAGLCSLAFATLSDQRDKKET